MAIIVTGVVLAGLGFVIGSRISGGSESGEPRPAPAQAPASNVIISVRGPEGLLQHVLIALKDDDGGYTLISVPARTIVDSPDVGFTRLDSLYNEEGRGAVAASIENLLSITLDHYVETDRETLASAAEQVEVITFSTEAPVSDSSGQELLTAGDNPTAASTALELLDASVTDAGSGSAIQAAFFSGLRNAVAAAQEPGRGELMTRLTQTLSSDLDESELTSWIAALTGSQQGFGLWPLPVTAGGSGEDWYYEPVLSQIEALIQGSNLAQEYRLEIQNGTETQGLVEAAAAKLEPLRYNISLDTEVSGVHYDHTQVRCGSDALGECDRVVEALGAGTIIKDEYLDSRQIIVIIGMDLAPDGA